MAQTLKDGNHNGVVAAGAQAAAYGNAVDPTGTPYQDPAKEDNSLQQQNNNFVIGGNNKFSSHVQDPVEVVVDFADTMDKDGFGALPSQQ